MVQVHQDSRGSSTTSNCSWYFVIYSVDSTLGMVLVLAAHEGCLRLARARLRMVVQQEALGTDLEVLNSNSNSPPPARRSSLCGEAGKRYQWVFEYIADCGEYGDPPDFFKWAVQVRPSDCLPEGRVA